MIEAMACGAPVFALPGGSVAEVVKDGVSGYICHSVDEMVQRAKKAPEFDFEKVRQYGLQTFSLDRMVQAYADLYAEILGERTASLAKRTLEMGELGELDDPRAIA
jgi:glycosyltransferase involved in cell wall biosynthesis